MAMALPKTLYEKSEIVADVYAPSLPSSPLPLASTSARVLGELLTLPELRAAVPLMRHRTASGPDKILSQALLNLLEAALLKLLEWHSEIWQTDYVLSSRKKPGLSLCVNRVNLHIFMPLINLCPSPRSQPG